MTRLRVYLERGRRSSLAAIVEDALAMVVFLRTSLQARDLEASQRIDGLATRASARSALCQSTASREFRRSVTSMYPGACVMQNSGFTVATTDCGVTPHAQNTGSSSSFTGTASP